MEDFISHCLIKMADGFNFDRVFFSNRYNSCLNRNEHAIVSKLDGKVSEINT